jgi:hypothetical protein
MSLDFNILTIVILLGLIALAIQASLSLEPCPNFASSVSCLSDPAKQDQSKDFYFAG